MKIFVGIASDMHIWRSAYVYLRQQKLYINHVAQNQVDKYLSNFK